MSKEHAILNTRDTHLRRVLSCVQHSQWAPLTPFGGLHHTATQPSGIVWGDCTTQRENMSYSGFFGLF